jgi:kinesin family protein 6/9
MVESALDGYNGTLFAYGQTGSGKTFTMTGGSEKYADRGIIPRAISHLFECIKSRTNRQITVTVSYLEIYNTEGYDLLSTGSSLTQQRNLEDLQKVIPFENAEGELVLKGLSIHRTEKEEDLLNTLFIGDTNRIVCETPMNDVSTRSHCIFTIYIESRENGSETKRLSKLHLVDLSGSERVGKTHIEGRLLKEACYINLSLHYLEHVIVCLQRKMRGEKVFVPYRNCLMTMVLKDSLGGNCKTRMIATVYPKDDNLDESIATCHFAQRVAMIKNTSKRNEVVDPEVIISRLKRENEELKSEVRILKGEDFKEKLTKEDERNCEEYVDQLMEDKLRQPKPFMMNDKLIFGYCMSYFRGKFWQAKDTYLQNSTPVEKEIKAAPVDSFQIDRLNQEVSKLQTLLKQRDNEISILLKMVNKGQINGDSADNSQQIKNEEKQLTFEKFEADASKLKQSSLVSSKTENKPKVNNFLNDSTIAPNPFAKFFVDDFKISPVELQNQKLCFELFRKHYKATSGIEQDMISLKGLYDRGKDLSTKVKTSKQQIESLKTDIEACRRQQEIRRVTEAYTGEWRPSPEEQNLHLKIGAIREKYVVDFESLKNLKAEVERMQHDLERRRASMQADFEKWLNYNYDLHRMKPVDQNQNPNSVKESGADDQSTKGYDSMTKDISLTKSSFTMPNASKISNANVQSDIAEFYKARNEAFKNLLGN